MNLVAPAAHLHGDAPSASTPQGEVDRKELAFIAMERTRMPMVVTDPRQPDNPIVLANRSFLNETGYSSEEVLGRNCRFLQGPQTDAESVDRVRAALRDEREIVIELINHRKDGTPFWNQLYISPVHDDDGQLLYFFASQLDTTKSHQAEDLEVAEQKLLREVDHRAKNALALVQGIVRLTKRNEAADFADAVQGRVDALARAHAILAEHRWRTVSLETILRGELGSLAPPRVRISGDAIELDPAQVQPLALLLHELVANAHRHGALSVAAGAVSITWQRDPTTGELRTIWTETGGPPPPQDRSPGYGQTMIDAIARRQLRGRIDYRWPDTGLVAEIAIPRAAFG
ncbi:PAS domain-containing protein [Sphingomonas sp. BIUV-7]|uniref:histidine kinase n=1 Tax=Sphingomonas natans TaxID=3063330 RepID=A0ABT8YF80_9SPHN|nr:PAS domain-containing protein [Sphingomonas sp. BIUV-7]MDO6416280.1 PAS domain-containing protein [Sphingomonas sp. BIUV-7]